MYKKDNTAARLGTCVDKNNTLFAKYKKNVTAMTFLLTNAWFVTDVFVNSPRTIDNYIHHGGPTPCILKRPHHKTLPFTLHQQGKHIHTNRAYASTLCHTQSANEPLHKPMNLN